MIPWKPNQQNYWTRCMAWEFCVMKCPCGPTSISVVPIQNTIRIQDHQLVVAHYLSCNLGIIASQKSTQIFWRLSSIHDKFDHLSIHCLGIEFPWLFIMPILEWMYGWSSCTSSRPYFLSGTYKPCTEKLDCAKVSHFPDFQVK